MESFSNGLSEFLSPVVLLSYALHKMCQQLILYSVHFTLCFCLPACDSHMILVCLLALTVCINLVSNNTHTVAMRNGISE